MARTILLLTWVTLLLPVASAQDAAPAKKAETSIENKASPIFDGKTLKGWNTRKGEEKLWTARDGMIVGGDGKTNVPWNTFIATDKSYKNFELRLDLRFVEGTGFANSGVQVRSLRIPNNREMIGYQIDAGVRWWGKIYDESRRNRVIADSTDPDAVLKAVKPWGWNHYRILCEGARIRTWINDVPAIDYTEATPNIPQDGQLGLQMHGGGAYEIQFKNLTIKELPDTPGAPTWESTGKEKELKAKAAKEKAAKDKAAAKAEKKEPATPSE